MEYQPHLRLVQKTTLELHRSSNPASSALSHTAWFTPPTSLWLSPQAMPFAVLETRSRCQIPVAAVPLNGKSTALNTESADPQGQMAVGRSTERRLASTKLFRAPAASRSKCQLLNCTTLLRPRAAVTTCAWSPSDRLRYHKSGTTSPLRKKTAPCGTV